MQRLFAARRCYAPPVPLGGAILFEHDVMHASYLRPGMTRARYSLDFRAVGEYEVDEANRPYSGKLFRRRNFTPWSAFTMLEFPAG
jgi:hypothetical protein